MINAGSVGNVETRMGTAKSWLSARVLACARGAVFGVLACTAEAGTLVLLAVSVLLSAIGIGLFLVPPMTLAIRRLTNLIRHLSGPWSGVTIPVPYVPEPVPDRGTDAFWRRYHWLFADPATWRDLLWLIADACIGSVVALLPAALVLEGVYGFLMPLEVGSTNWYAFIHVTDTSAAWLCLPLGALFLALGLWSAPSLLHFHGRFAHSLLAPTRRAELAAQAHHLTQTRADAVDTNAAELRRIERDLHDGAQARLVAMGMTLGAADDVFDEDPAAARALLLEARAASAKALTELRDLARGIHPPVLADRGLVAALRALALDSALNVDVTSTLTGRPPAAVESACYFAVSELLTNASKHADARKVEVILRSGAKRLEIEVIDDGHGGANLSAGSGLRGIERRVAAFDGTLTISSPAGGPTTATIVVPCALSSPKTSSY